MQICLLTRVTGNASCSGTFFSSSKTGSVSFTGPWGQPVSLLKAPIPAVWAQWEFVIFIMALTHSRQGDSLTWIKYVSFPVVWRLFCKAEIKGYARLGSSELAQWIIISTRGYYVKQRPPVGCVRALYHFSQAQSRLSCPHLAKNTVRHLHPEKWSVPLVPQNEREHGCFLV